MSVFVSLARQALIEADLLYVTGPDIQQIMTDNTRHVMDVSRAPGITSHLPPRHDHPNQTVRQGKY